MIRSFVRIRPLSLLAKFSLLAFVLFALLGYGLSFVMTDVIEDRARDNAVGSARAIAQLGIAHYVTQDDLREGLGPDRIEQLDRQLLARELNRVGIDRVNIFNREPRIVYSDNHAKIGADARDSESVRRALSGEVLSELVMGTDHDGAGAQQLEVFVPIRLNESGSVSGVFEVYLPYEPVAAAARRDERTVYAMMAVGLIALFLALYRIVAAASRNLREQLRENRHQATHDALTGLPNRTMLSNALHGARSEPGRLALLMLDLDGFKEINDALGHEQGDAVLVEVGRRLGGVAGSPHLLARLGGDEFAVLVRSERARDDAQALAERLRDTLREPFSLPDAALAIRLDASIGIAAFGDGTDAASALMRHADIAMYRAKRDHSGVEFYRPDVDAQHPARLALAGELSRALDEEELHVHFQPQVATATGAVVAAEALVRWQHPERGLLAPDQFIPLAETTGIIGDLTRYVLTRALAQQARWRAAGHDLAVAVNFAGPNMVDASMRDSVVAALEQHGTDPSRLIVEVSERTVVNDPERLVVLLQELREIGVVTSLDDFGTGRSSLTHARSLPVDEIKVDRSFVMGMATSGGDAAIVNATLAVAEALALRVVAEGVEDEATLDALKAAGCAVVQGYLISRPVPADAFLEWLNARAAGPSAGTSRRPVAV